MSAFIENDDLQIVQTGCDRSMSIFIIAEAGVNHNGDIHMAKRLVEEAAEAGADAVKFQSFKAASLVTKTAAKAAYQSLNSPWKIQFDMLKSLELDANAHLELIFYCNSLGIEFLSSPFDFESIELLKSLGLKTVKIPSGEIDNIPYLRRLVGFDKIILSTGMADLSDIETALLTLDPDRDRDVSVLHCNTQYPTPYEDVNLKAMLTIKNTFSVKVGYSDHTEGIEVSLAAAALGASVIEKHFTLDKTLPGPDHRASLDPRELKALVKGVRNIEKAMGSELKSTSPSEAANKLVVRKSIVAAREIRKGEMFDENNLAVKRPGTGISPKYWDMVVGSQAKRDYKADEFIEV